MSMSAAELSSDGRPGRPSHISFFLTADAES